MYFWPQNCLYWYRHSKTSCSKILLYISPSKQNQFHRFNNNITAALSNFEHLDLNSLVSYFISTLSSLLNKHAPEQKPVHTTTHFSNSWFKLNLLHERQKKRQLERARHKSHSNNDCLLYGNQCWLYNSLLKKAQSNYFSLLFVNCFDLIALWYSIN